MAAPAPAADTNTEVEPEMWAFLDLSDRARLFFLGNFTGNLTQSTANETFGVHLDLALKPILRHRLRVADWARKKYLWMRIGYRESFGGNVRETGLVEATSREPLPRQFWLVNRFRTDLRNEHRGFSARPRYRLGVEREIPLGKLTVMPYVRIEFLYDTLPNAWSRRYEAGAELALTRHWRVEPYYERQHSSNADTNRIGFIVKTFW